MNDESTGRNISLKCYFITFKELAKKQKENFTNWVIDSDQSLV